MGQGQLVGRKRWVVGLDEQPGLGDGRPVEGPGPEDQGLARQEREPADRRVDQLETAPDQGGFRVSTRGGLFLFSSRALLPRL